MKPDPDFTSKNVIKMEGQWAAQRVHGQWMRTRTRLGRRGSRKHGSTPVPSFSFRSSSLPDLPVLWVCSNTPPIFYLSGWQWQKHKFQNTCPQPLLSDQTTPSHNTGIMRKPVCFPGLPFFWHWSASCYNHSEIRGDNWRRTNKCFYILHQEIGDFHILYMRKNSGVCP